MSVSRQAAIDACEQVRAHNARRFWSPTHWQCWGCMKYGGEPDKRCMRSDDGWDACPHVNRWIEEHQPAAPPVS